MIETQKIEYLDSDYVLEGYCAVDNRITGKRPAVLIVHDWTGRNEFVEKKAEMMAEWGYLGFAVDMYGTGKVGKTNEEKGALMKPLVADRAALRDRIVAGLEAVKKITDVDTTRIATIGFCFGGLCALDLARSGADIRGAVSFHGQLTAPENVERKKIRAKILVLHGHDDPMVPPEQVLNFQKEMTEAKADWQVHTFGGTKHAFTNPLANDQNLGLVYSSVADKRSMKETKHFLEEVFA